MGKAKLEKNRKKKGSKKKGKEVDVDDETGYRVGALGDLVVKSCVTGDAEPEFDPALSSLFSIKKDDEGPKLKKHLKLTSKPGETKKLKGNAESKVAVVAEGNTEVPMKGQSHPKKIKNKKNKSKATEAQSFRISTKVEEVEEEGIDESSPEAEKPATSKSAGEVKKRLRDLNAPKKKDDELESRTIFVGNVPKEATKKQIMKLFKGMEGSIETIRLRCAAPDKPVRPKKIAMNKKELHPDRASVAAYIRYTSKEEAQQVVEKCRAEGVVFGEHHLTVDMADRSLARDNRKSVFVGNLHLKAQDEELWSIFADCGTIESVRIVRDQHSGLGKGFGYVNFSDGGSVELALQKNETELRSRPLRISRCVKKQKKLIETGLPKKQGGGGKPTVSNQNNAVRRLNHKSSDFVGTFGKAQGRFKPKNSDEKKKARMAKRLNAPKGVRVPFNKAGKKK